jgi:hypothetical protein
VWTTTPRNISQSLSGDLCYYGLYKTFNTKEVSTISDTNNELAVTPDSDLEALLAQQETEFSSDVLTVPILKVGQALTKEVKAGDAEEGEFINSLTGEGLGNQIGFIVAYYQEGRFAATKDGKAYVAFGNLIPERWEPFVGAEWVGTPFSEYPEAEEQFKAAVNAKEREWGSGPAVSTTRNFTGFALVPGLEAGDEELLLPVRLSLKRTDVPAANKMISLKTMLRLRTFWDIVFDLTTAIKPSGSHESYVVKVKQGRPTTDDEKMQAVALAQSVVSQRVRDNQEAEAESDAADQTAAPKGALGV